MKTLVPQKPVTLPEAAKILRVPPVVLARMMSRLDILAVRVHGRLMILPCELRRHFR